MKTTITIRYSSSFLTLTRKTEPLLKYTSNQDIEDYVRVIPIPHVLVLRSDRSSRTGIGNTGDKRDRELLNYSFKFLFEREPENIYFDVRDLKTSSP